MFRRISRRLRAFIYNHAPKIRQARIFCNIRAVAFSVKEFILFFIIFLVGSLAGGFINGFLNIGPGEGWIGYILFLSVPILLIYLIWKNWGQEAAA